MSEVLELLILLLLVVTIIIIVIEINALIKKQANLVIEVQKREGYINPSGAYNDAAILAAVPNYLRTTEQNAKDVKDAPSLIPYHNGSRGEQAINYAVPSKQQMNLKDSNSSTGLRNSVSFPGPINPTPNKIEIAGADIRTTNVKYDDTSVAKPLHPDISLDSPDSTFSVNSRTHASAAQALMPNESSAEAVIEGMRHKKTYKVGKL